MIRLVCDIKSHSTKLLLLVLLLSPLILFSKTPAGQAAADIQSISISPTSADPIIDPGATSSGSIQVFNQGNNGYDYAISVTPYSVSGENYNPTFTLVAGYPNITGWFSFDTTKSHLNSGDSNTISYTINVPKTTLPGSYYAVVFAETQPQQLNSTSIIAKKRVGTIFYITVAGQAVNSAKVASWNVPLFQKPPITATLRFENDGSVYQNVNYHIVMKNLLTGKTTTFDDSRYVLQQTIRRIAITWAGSPSLGLFKVSGTVSYSGQTVDLPIHYTAVSSILNLIIIIVLITLVITTIVVLFLKHNRKKKNASKRA